MGEVFLTKLPNPVTVFPCAVTVPLVGKVTLVAPVVVKVKAFAPDVVKDPPSATDCPPILLTDVDKDPAVLVMSPVKAGT